MMFDKANLPLICTNHTAGFSRQKRGTGIPTRLIVKVESGGCSGRDDASVFAACCVHGRNIALIRENTRFPICGITSVVVYE